jgi:hypothetical protein
MRLMEQAEECAKREALSPFCVSVVQEAFKKVGGRRKNEASTRENHFLVRLPNDMERRLCLTLA